MTTILILSMDTTTDHITLHGVKGIEGLQIPRKRLLATYTPAAYIPSDKCCTRPTLLLEWGDANLFFVGLKANEVRSQLRAQNFPVEIVRQVERFSHA
jgi:hypothetical protein